MTDKKNYDVDILEVNLEANTIKVKFHSGSEKEFLVVEPCKINYCKVGKASIGILNDEVNYCRSGVSSNFKPNNSGYKKPYNSNFQKGNNYTPVKKKVKNIFVGELTTDEMNAVAQQINSENSCFATQTHVENGKWYACFFIHDE